LISDNLEVETRRQKQQQVITVVMICVILSGYLEYDFVEEYTSLPPALIALSTHKKIITPIDKLKPLLLG